jgi:hypothetical protein
MANSSGYTILGSLAPPCKEGDLSLKGGSVSLMKKFLIICGLVSSLTFLPSFLQGKETKFPAQEFSKVKSILCPAQTMEDLKAIHSTCTLSAFSAKEADLDGDGTAEWLFFGPSGECGAHGNCPMTLLGKQKGKWVDLSREKCGNSDECLNYGNALYSEILKTSHNGYRDLLISSDSGSFFWIKSVYEWNGKQYRQNKNGMTYFFYDSDKEQLVQVNKERWDNCTKSGKDCLP